MIPPLFSENTRRAAFTLIEILVVVAILGVLAALLLLMLGSMMANGKRTQSASNMRQIGIAVLQYVGEHEGKYPQSIAAGNPLQTWHQTIAPYLGYTPPEGNWQNLVGKPAGGIWNNPANKGVPGDLVTSGNYADYGWNFRLGGWGNSGGAPHMKTIQRPVKIPNPSQVYMVTEVKECKRDFRDGSGWHNAAAYHPRNTLNMLFADGHIEVLEIDKLYETETEFDYPWGWPGYEY